MRNVFDQFKHHENQLTHALMSSLHEDASLLNVFVRWATGQPAPNGKLTIVEQSLPGEEREELIDETRQRSLPDGWVYNEDGWALLIENKINCPLTADQIKRHRLTAQRRGFPHPYILALVPDLRSAPLDSDLKIQRWTELYTWLKEQPDKCGWVKRLYEYMEILEAKLMAKTTSKAVTLTVFTGVPFNNDSPYNYLEAKRVLRLAMEKLRTRDDLQSTLGVDAAFRGRGAIKGKDATSIWDYLRLSASNEAKKHTEFPHLTLDIRREFLQALIILPNSSPAATNLTGQVPQKSIGKKLRRVQPSVLRNPD